MSEPTYTFSPQTNQTVSEEMTAANNEIKTKLEQMHGELMSTLRMWQTPDSKRMYETRKARWDDAADSMPRSLQIATQTLLDITNRMKMTELHLTQSW